MTPEQRAESCRLLALRIPCPCALAQLPGTCEAICARLNRGERLPSGQDARRLREAWGRDRG